MGRPSIGVLVGGLVAGTFDILYAIVVWLGRGRSPEWVLQSVATGWLGQPAFDGGVPAAALGLVSHYGISIAAAAIFYLVSKRVSFLRERAVLSGLVFGICVFLVMNFVVMPLSAAPFKIKYTASVFAQGFASHAILFGVPIALAVRYFSARKEPA
jgi:uncharacterized membrane protein YagU involved in acid resistance